MKVGTYYHERPGRVPRKSHINAYTIYYSESWPGCVVFDVEASSGKEAKEKAVEMRLRLEIEKFLHGPAES